MMESFQVIAVKGIISIWLVSGCCTFLYIVFVLNNQDVVTHASVSPAIYWMRFFMSLGSSLFGWPFLLALFKIKRTRAYKQNCEKWLNQKGLQLHDSLRIRRKT